MGRMRQWGLLSALGVAGVCLWWLLAGRSGATDPARIGLWGGLVLLSAATATVVLEVVGRSRRERAARRERLLDRLQERAGRAGGHTVTVPRWRGVLPARVVVDLPAGGVVDDELRSALAREIGQAVAAAGGPRRWGTRKSLLRARVTLTPQSTSPTEDARQETIDRTVSVVRKTIPGARSVRVTEWTEDGEPAQVLATYEPSPRLSSTTVEAAVLRVVGHTLPGRWRAEWDREHDQVTFERKPGLPELVDRPADLVVPDQLMLRYGVDPERRVHAWYLGGTAPHCLVIGPTGGGKTFALRAMALDALSQGMVVHGADPKMIELVGLEGLPGVGTIATEPEEIAALIQEMNALMLSRYADLKALRVRREDLQPVLFILDEFFILRMRLARAWKAEGGKGEHPALGMVPELLALARSARIHLCIGIQRPDAEFLQGAARDNLRHRVSLSQLSPNGAEMMWDDRSIGTDLPPVPGRAVATGPTGPVEIQVYRVPEPDLRLRHERTTAELEVLKAALATAAPVSGRHDPDRLHLEGRATLTVVEPTLLEPRDVTLEGSQLWGSARADALVAGDRVRLDGEVVHLTEVDVDEADEDYVVLSWPTGTVALPADEVVERAA